ncbi:unnamed protein product [Orchesella dallaii]|uniref:Uncharacterized protein n=1 Tax=Orchesella dallaii TaxID=48710 RepID=A0ABP1RZQ0_9HEXA
MASRALKDAEIDNDGEVPVKELAGTNWVILRKSMTWEEAYWNCEVKYFRLVMLPTLEKAEELSRNIADISEPYTPEYMKKRHEVEFGMDRRYWTGLTDQLKEGKWLWAHNG